MNRTIAVPAKLNLTLHITGRRPDGYHLLESLVAFTEYGDALEISPADTLSLTITGPFAAALQQNPDDNLVMRAARLLQPYAGGQGARLTLHKQIPVGAGLGGGSGDAATTLKGLIAHWKLSIEHRRVMEMALSLGSDVPVCYGAHTAWVCGIGEKITSCDTLATVWVLLVNPGVPLPTADVYRRFSEAFAASVPAPATLNSFDGLVAEISGKRNMLEPAAIQLLPVISGMLSHIRATPGCRIARMSGSGATCFGLYEHEDQARRAEAVIKQHYPQGWAVTTKLKADHEA